MTFPRTHCTNCVLLVESLSWDWIVMELLCYCILKCGANDTKPNVRLIKIPIQCFGYMVFGNNMSFLIRAWKISNKCSILCTFVCISPAKHSIKRAHGAQINGASARLPMCQVYTLKCLSWLKRSLCIQLIGVLSTYIRFVC